MKNMGTPDRLVRLALVIALALAWIEGLISGTLAVILGVAALILLLTIPDYNVLFVVSFFVGGAAGGILPVWPGLVAFRFGRNALGQVMGLMGPIVISLQGFGAPLAAKMGYQSAFMLFLGFLAVSLFVSRNLNKPAA